MKKGIRNKKAVIFTSVLVIVFATLGIFLVTNHRDDAVDISLEDIPLSGAPVTVTAGDKFVITVAAPSVEDMYGYQFRVNYNAADYVYSGELKSDINGIDTIFAKPFEGYELVGATMIGERAGVNGTDQIVCHMTFESLRDTAVSDESISISDVSVVTSTLEYNEDILGWTYSAALLP